VVAYHNVFFLGREYTDDEFSAELARRGIPAILVVTDATTDAPTVTAHAAAIPICYRRVGGVCVSGSTVVTSGQRVSQNNFTIASQVLDLASAEVLWVGSTRIKRQGATDRQLLTGMARDVLKSLVRDGVLDVVLNPP
jgi:hypothetical protein